MQKITPFLWFDGRAAEAAEFYLSVFKNSEIICKTHVGNTDVVMSVSIRIEGSDYFLFNGGPHFSFTPAISLFVSCESQIEVNELWEMLSTGGEKSRCGWLKDKFGLSWQIIPSAFSEMVNDPDTEKAKRVMNALMNMSKIDIQVLRKAYNNEI